MSDDLASGFQNVDGASDFAAFSDELRAADADGRFFSSYTGFLVAGRKPSP